MTVKDELDLRLRLASWRILERITPRRQAQYVLGVSILLGIAKIVDPSIELPPQLAAFAAGVGGLGSLVRDIAEGKEVSSDEILATLDEILPESELYQLMKEHSAALGEVVTGDQWQALYRLVEEQGKDGQQTAIAIQTSLSAVGIDVKEILRLLGEEVATRDDLARQTEDILAGFERAAVLWPGSPYEPAPVRIPVVVAALTRDSARKLLEEREDIRNYLELYGIVAGVGVENWLEHYGATPEQWKPFFFPDDTGAGRTIESLVWQAFLDFQAKSDDSARIVPDFRAIEPLGEHALLIIDPFLLFDDSLSHELQVSGMTTQRRTQTMILNPVDLMFLEAHRSIEGLVRSKLKFFHRYYSEDLWLECEIGDGRLSSTRRWLHHRLHTIAAMRGESLMTPEARSSIHSHFQVPKSGNGSGWAQQVRGSRQL